MKKSKKKAFTLTELLVVVIVIGVLSAAVLPKFSKVIETRKTTEAEELMASVRTEQEKRCALDKQYLTQMSEMTDIVKNNDTKNFTITLAERGIDAASKGKYNYTLKMPSYADGRICCDGTECNKLNKNYPTCEELRGKPDYQESPADCAGVISEPEEPSGPCDIDPYSCECNPNQAKCCADDEVWQDGKCSPKPKECTGPKPATSQECNKCGTQTRTVTCDTTTGEWVEGEFGECSIDDETKCEENTTCEAKRKAGELKSYCAQHGLFPEWYFSSRAPLSPSNCCQSCEDAGGIEHNGDCVYGGWYAEATEESIGIRYGKSYPTVTLRQDQWGWSGDASSAIGMLSQYGPQFGGVCDFSGYDKISSSSLSNFDEDAFRARCTKCGLKDTCNVTGYKLRDNWNLMYDSSKVKSEAVCCLYANDYRGSTLGEMANCEGLALVGNHCGDETGGIGDLCYPTCGKDYTKLGLSFTMTQIAEFKKRCEEARESNKNVICKNTTGIPSDAYTYSNESYGVDTSVWGNQYTESNCRAVLSESNVDVYGAVVQKWECVKNPDAGVSVFD